MWIQLISTKYIDVNGTTRRYFPGDWVDVGKQTALQWIAANEARVPNPLRSGLLIAGSGVGVWGTHAHEHPGLPEVEFTALPETLSIPYHLTCLWQPPLRLSTDLLAAGFGLLQTWQIAVPLWNYDVLANGVGKGEAQARTKAVVRDLRIPLYDVRLIFLRRCPETEQLLAVWNEERKTGDPDQLTFLRALYQVKPLVLALPMTWTQKDLYL